MRSYAGFNSICGALGVGFILGIFLVFRSASAQEHVSVEIKDVPILEQKSVISNQKSETMTISLSEEESQNKQLLITDYRLPNNSKLPSKINLNVPFTSQAPERNWEQPWQDACEEAAALMLDAYYKGYNLSPLFARDEILKMVEWETKQGWEYSIPMEKVHLLYEDFVAGKSEVRSQKSEVIVDPTVEQIRKSIAAGHPVLAVAHGKDLPNPYFREGGPEYHALIIRGYTEDSFITNDPGTWRGENFAYKYNDLMNAIHDWNNGDVKEGHKAVLMMAGVTD